MTIIQSLGDYNSNQLWIKREDLIPFSFGGNKARKAELFFQEIDKGNYNCVVTYGSSSSNHCRVVANECCRRGIACYIISPEDVYEETFNSKLMTLFNAKLFKVPVCDVHDTIEKVIDDLKQSGNYPYFIEGGGHGNIGTEAYVKCYREIQEYEKNENVFFDYIFFASGTGTTQAGLVCGQLLENEERKIIGISIARKNPRGRDVIIESIKSYMGDRFNGERVEKSTYFIDEYTEGYGKDDIRVKSTIESIMKKYGIPLDMTYTGKAFMGMTEYLKNIKDKNVLFIHTGGTPLFFDALRR